MGAVLCRTSRALAIVCLLMFTAPSVFAQQGSTVQPAQPDGHPVVETVKFIAGGALGLVMHESGHLIFDAAFDAKPRISRVEFGPIPFFAISHRDDLSPRREFTISSAGFWVQEATNEWLLTRRPSLRDEHAWGVKGVLAFNVLNSVGYALVAFAKAGPAERDTRGMADSIRVDERVVGAIILTPAVLDAYRYFKRGSRWATWTSRAVKIGSVVLVLKRR
jgi:hypothetical protein